MISSIAADVGKEGDRAWIIGTLAPRLWGQSGENERENWVQTSLALCYAENLHRNVK